MSSDNNVLRADGTKYIFKEVGSFQVSTSTSGYTLGIEHMFSGEAQSYFNETKSLLYSLSKFIALEDQIEEDVH